MRKKYYYLKKNDIIKDGDEVKIDGEYIQCSLTIGDCAGDYCGVPFRREIKQAPQPTKSKISKLKEYLLKGYLITPLAAWKMWSMAHNSFNRQIWELRHKHGLQIESQPTVGINGAKFNMHWIKKENLK